MASRNQDEQVVQAASSRRSSCDAGAHIERTSLLHKDSSAMGVESPSPHATRSAARQSRLDRYTTSRSARAQLGLGIAAGILILVLCALAALALVEGPGGGGMFEGLQQQIRDRVPEGHDINVPPGSGQPIKQGTKTVPNDTVSELLPALDDRVDYGALLKPRFHLTAPSGWMNDPNGMLQLPNAGPVHVFYQWNPAAAKWGSPWWGHVVSWDLVKWRRLPAALKPDAWYDSDGVFSGSATLLPDGTPVMLYTGVMNFSMYNFYYQTQAAAVPANLSDPLLLDWVKLAINPLQGMDVPPGGSHAQFRDPMTAWRVDDSEVAGLLAGLEDKAGGASSHAGRRLHSLGARHAPVGPLAASSQRMLLGGGDGGIGGTGVSYRTAPSVPSGRRLLGRPGQAGGSTSWDSAWQSSARRQLAGTTPSRRRQLPQSGAAGSSLPDVQGWWMTAVGVQDDCLGAAALYLSNDTLRTWHYAGTLYSQLSQNYSEYSACIPPGRDADAGVPPGSRGYGGHCDQFGQGCRMWECPDFFPLPAGVQAFKYSDQNRARLPFAADYYVLGDASLTNYSLALSQDGQDAYAGSLGGAVYEPRLLDYGVVYASKSFALQDGRRVWLGWVYEDSLGCSEVCGDGTPFIHDRQQWQGAQTLLREITFDAGTQTLRFKPVAETVQLRVTPALVSSGYRLDTAGAAKADRGPAAQTVLPGWEVGAALARNVSSPSGGRQVEVSATFALMLEGSGGSGGSGDAVPFNVTLRIHTGNATYTDVVLSGHAVPPSSNNGGSQLRPAWVQDLSVHVDRMNSGGMTPNTSYGGAVPVPAPAAANATTTVSVQLFVDRSLLEVYVQSGLGVVTSRVYPTPRLPADASSNGTLADGRPDLAAVGAWGYELLAAWEAGPVHADVTVYELGSCWEAGEAGVWGG